MGFLDDIRKRKNSVRKKVDEFLDRGSELENQFKDIKEDASGKILETADTQDPQRGSHFPMIPLLILYKGEVVALESL